MPFGKKKREGKFAKAKKVLQKTQNETCPVKGCGKRRNHGGKHDGQ